MAETHRATVARRTAPSGFVEWDRLAHFRTCVCAGTREHMKAKHVKVEGWNFIALCGSKLFIVHRGFQICAVTQPSYRRIAPMTG